MTYRIKCLFHKHSNGILAALLTAAVVAGCGIPLGGGGSSNEPAPQGNIVQSGPLTGAGASGTAEIYNLTSGAGLVLRLDTFTVTANNGLQVRISGGAGTVVVGTLVGTTGSENFTINTSGPLTLVSIHDPGSNQDVATASLTPAN